MKKIGSGLQFKVYDFGNGKVLKKPKSDLEMYLANLLWEPYLIFSPRKLKGQIKQAKKDREFAIKYFKKYNSSELLANLEIFEKGIFQDKVIPLKRILGNNYEKDKELIDKYSQFIFECWKEGFADKIYNFSVNNGINSNGKIVLIDFAEIIIEKEKIKQQILSERWKKARDYIYIIKGNSKIYYEKKMKETLTLENLEKYWKFNKS